MKHRDIPTGPPCPACGNATYDTVWGCIKQCGQCDAYFECGKCGPPAAKRPSPTGGEATAQERPEQTD